MSSHCAQAKEARIHAEKMITLAKKGQQFPPRFAINRPVECRHPFGAAPSIGLRARACDGAEAVRHSGPAIQVRSVLCSSGWSVLTVVVGAGIALVATRVLCGHGGGLPLSSVLIAAAPLNVFSRLDDNAPLAFIEYVDR